MIVGDDVTNNVHQLSYDRPEECTIPCAMELPWTLTEIAFNSFSAKEIFDLGAGDAFKIYESFLKLLQWQSPDRDPSKTWVLTCPNHFPYLNDLRATFSESVIIWTHRNPIEW